VKQLAGALAPITERGLEPERAEATEADPGQDARHRRLGHPA
jgi:hypothetical protein